LGGVYPVLTIFKEKIMNENIETILGLNNENYKIFIDGHDMGGAEGAAFAQWKMANDMRILFCALITCYKKEDYLGVESMIEIIKNNLSQYVKFKDEDWAVFRNDIKPKPHA
jgi:hypothetical protein